MLDDFNYIGFVAQIPKTMILLYLFFIKIW